MLEEIVIFVCVCVCVVNRKKCRAARTFQILTTEIGIGGNMRIMICMEKMLGNKHFLKISEDSGKTIITKIKY